MENEHAGTSQQGEQKTDEVSLLDLLLVVSRNLRTIVLITASITALAVVYSVLAPTEYSSEARVVRESQSEVPGGIRGGLSALRGFGIDLGSASSGMTPEAYPALLKSREVRLAVARDTFRFEEADTTMTLVDYEALEDGWFSTLTSTIKKYTIGLPGLLLSEESSSAPPSQGSTEIVTQLSEDEEDAIGTVDGMIGVSVDTETGIMTVSATTSEPKLSATVAARAIYHLTNRIREIRTEKSRENLTFIQNRFEEAREELRAAEERLAAFMDRNRDMGTASLRTERDRLQRQVGFKSDLYSELQAQVTQAQIQVKKSEPVITVVEAPAVPFQRSAPQRKLIVIGAFAFGLVLSLGVSFVRSFVQTTGGQDERKLQEIQRRFSISTWRERLPGLASPSEHGGGSSSQTG
jgi:uncharacterized protein involved in exopolysaccharide biosynthesis